MKHLFTTFLLLLSLHGFSQNQGATNNKTNSSLTTEQKIYEVYGAQFFVGKSSVFQFYNNLLNNRIAYRHQPQQPDEKHPTVHAMGLQNKINSSITNHTSFDAATFNPLHYKLDFFAKTTKIYRIDNSDYLLVIKPQ